MSVVTSLSLLTLLPLVTSHIHPHARSAKKSESAEEVKNHLELELESFNSDSLEKMTEEERDYHYFRLHDFDKNDLLDGLEVLKAMSHTHGTNSKGEIPPEEHLEGTSFDDMVVMIDKVDIDNIQNLNNCNPYVQVLEKDDVNKDGFLSYSEFVAGRRREEKLQNDN